MEVTHDVILDLLPVYFSGEASASTKTLVDVVSLDAEDQNSHHDIGGSIIPALVEMGEAHVYDFTTNHVPGETEPGRQRMHEGPEPDALHHAFDPHRHPDRTHGSSVRPRG